MRYRKQDKSIFALCWFVYFTSYLGRQNYSYAMPSLLSLDIIKHEAAGLPNFLFFLSYGLGQLVNGYLGDRVNPRWMVFYGLILSAFSNIMMSLFTSALSMSFFWALNGYVQSMIWPALVFIFAHQFPDGIRQNASIDIISSLIVGNIVSLLVSSLLLVLASWRCVFYFATFSLTFTAVFWLCAYRCRGNEKTQNKVLQKEEMKPFPIFLSLISFLVPVFVHGIIKDGIFSWIPTYFHEQFDLSPSMALLVMVFIPLCKLAGAGITRFLLGRNLDEEKSVRLLWFCITIAMVVLWLGRNTFFLNCLMLSLSASLILAINTIYINIMPLRYRNVSMVSGSLNALAYIGSAIASISIGNVSSIKGWSAVIMSWLLTCLVAFSLNCMRMPSSFASRWKR